MEEKDMNRMIGIALHGGNANYGIFNYDKDQREEFLRRYGWWERASRAETLRDEAAFTADAARSRQCTDEAKKLEREIYRECRKQLQEAGVDLEKVLGPEREWEEMVGQLAEQLQAIGIDRETAAKAGLLDEEIITRGADGRFTLADTVSQREKLKKAGIDFTAKDGRITIDVRLKAKKGVAYEDTPDNRRRLDEAELEYIEMALGHNLHSNGRNALFVPFNWLNRAEQGYNSKLAQNIKQLALIGGAALFTGPGVTLALFVALRRTPLRQNLFKAHELTYAQRKAIEQGLTAYKENRDRQGNIHPTFYYQENGMLYSVAAHDVRIPEKVNGVKLSPLQREKLRQGELLELCNDKGEEFGLRVDLTHPNGLREYYRAMKSDKTMTAKPGAASSDDEKLSWIAKHGAQGVDDIFGRTDRDLVRDAFLARYGLKDSYAEYRNAQRVQGKDPGTDRGRKAEASMQETDARLRSMATDELEKISKSRGR